ncbi:anthrone oxygenase family protein [Streptomyces xanthochromogenes]|uniref:anthrone oxygenase family protein n=1 Tax=Streptomyces xanthochromogenes TaxID=67384 RepID=UPI003427419C
MYGLSMAVTAMVNIPLNNQLALAGPYASAARSRFGNRWTSGNLVRTVACTAALTALGRVLTLHGRAAAA